MIGLIFWTSVALVVYTYAGYPALVTAVARFASPRRDPAAQTPKMTLVIAAFNEESVIEQKLADTLQLDYPSHLLQVIVAADGSDDATPEIVRTFGDEGVELVHRPERAGKMAALERAMEWATGDIIVFSDANNSLSSDALRQLAIPYGDPEVGAVTGRKTVTSDDGLGYSEGTYWRYEAHLRSMETRLGCTVAVNGEIFSIRRSLFVNAPPGTINDDAWMALGVIRAGYRVVYRPQAVSTERVSSRLGEEVERRSRMVAGQYQMLRRARLPWRRPLVLWMFVSHKMLRPLVPFGMIGAAAASVLSVIAPGSGALSLGQPWNWVSLGANAAFYGLAAIGPRVTGLLGKAAYVPTFLAASNAAALKGLWRHLTGGQSAVWKSASRPGSDSR